MLLRFLRLSCPEALPPENMYFIPPPPPLSLEEQCIVYICMDRGALLLYGDLNLCEFCPKLNYLHLDCRLALGENWREGEGGRVQRTELLGDEKGEKSVEETDSRFPERNTRYHIQTRAVYRSGSGSGGSGCGSGSVVMSFGSADQDL
jgi:hypothetical protein